MLLKKQEKDGKIKAMYASSTLCASIFDKTTRDLVVIFNNGGQYKYPNVELTDYTRFETSESNGSTFNTYIKKKYLNFEKLDKLAEDKVQAILTEVKQLKEAEDEAALKGATTALINAALTLSADFVKTSAITPSLLTQLKSKIELYEKITTPAEPDTVLVSN